MKPALGLVLLALPFCAWSQSTPDQIVHEINGLKDPAEAATPNSDKVQLGKDVVAYSKKKDGLILQLYKTAPNDERTAGYMDWRWQQGFFGEHYSELVALKQEDGLAKMKALAKDELGDIDRILAANPGSGIKEVALSNKISVIEFAQSASEALPLIDEFAKQFPKSKKTPMMLFAATQMGLDPDAKQAVLNRIAKDYPDFEQIESVKASLAQMAKIGQPFELSFKDAVTGRTVDIKELKGKVVLVDFWATWCGPCVAEMPHLKEFYAKYHPQGVEILGVSLDEPEANGGLKALKDFVAKNGIPWSQYYQGNGWQSKFSSAWGIQSIPATFAIDKQGKLYGSVEPRSDNFEDQIKKLLAAN